MSSFPAITSLMYVVNPKRNDTISDLEVVLYKGKDHMIEEMENLKFKIGPVSFFQTNSLQAYKLYQVARDFADLRGMKLCMIFIQEQEQLPILSLQRIKRLLGLKVYRLLFKMLMLILRSTGLKIRFSLLVI